MKLATGLMPLWVIGFLAGCATNRYGSVVMHAMDNGPAGLPRPSATASFKLPAGWSGTATDPNSQDAGRFSLHPARLTGDSGHPSMDVLFGYLDPTVPYTQEGRDPPS